MSTSKDPKAKDTLGSTFSLFFGPTEETAGTGTVTRVIKGELTDIVVDADEKAAHQAKQRAQADAHNADQEAIWELMDRLNN